MIFATITALQTSVDIVDKNVLTFGLFQRFSV